MKSTIISMFVVLIVMVALPMIFLGEGNFAEKLGFSGFGGKGGSPAKLPTNVKAAVTDKKVEVYTWVDENGIKQFSNTPPPEGGDSEKMVLSPNTNIMDPVNIPEEEVEVASRPRVYNLGNPYTPGGMKDVVDNTKDIKETMGQRQADQEKMMQDLFKQQ
jgi:hypothetical protein